MFLALPNRGDTIGVVHRLKNGAPAHILSRDDRAKGGRARAAKARERRGSLLNERRGSKRLEEAAQRLGELLRSKNMEDSDVGGRSHQAAHPPGAREAPPVSLHEASLRVTRSRLGPNSRGASLTR
jgi:hypothetical protein